MPIMMRDRARIVLFGHQKCAARAFGAGHGWVVLLGHYGQGQVWQFFNQSIPRRKHQFGDVAERGCGRCRVTQRLLR